MNNNRGLEILPFCERLDNRQTLDFRDGILRKLFNPFPMQMELNLMSTLCAKLSIGASMSANNFRELLDVE